MPRSPIDHVVRSARRRLITQAWFERTAIAIAIGFAIGLTWFIVEPLVLESPPEWLRWTVLGSVVLLTGLVALLRSIRKAPSRMNAALEVDARFDLRERIATAVSLPSEVRTTAAGVAVCADADTHAAKLRVREKFPLQFRQSALLAPALAGCVALVAFVYHPITDSPAWVEAHQKPEAEKARLAGDPGRKPIVPPNPRMRRKDEPDRPNKSEAVKELEARLDKLERQARDANDPAEAREKVTEITSAQDRAKQEERERFDKLARIEQQLRQLEKLDSQDGFKDGPARNFNDSLARGDLKAAEEAVDELRKKAKDKKLDEKQKEKLDDQLHKMEDELQRLSRNKDEQEKLEQLAKKAKEEGRDTEGLEKELDRLKRDAEQLKSLEDLAQKLKQARQSLKAGDMEQLARDLERVKDQMQDLQGEAEDLKDIQDDIAKLDELKREMGRKAKDQKQAQGQPGAGGDDEDGPERLGRKKEGQQGNGNGPGGRGTGSGDRPENPNAPTARGPEERQRSPFDARGRKQYGGAVAGPAFTKRSPVEMSSAIEQAVQEAPEALDAQRLSRDDKDAVKEFFQSLGNQKR